MHLVFRFAPEADLQSALPLKVEINTREHVNLFGIRQYPFAIENDWYQRQAEIASFEPEELLEFQASGLPKPECHYSITRYAY